MNKVMSYRQLSLALVCVATAFLYACGREAPTFTPFPTGSISVLSTPSGAEISLDDLPTGLVTPDTLETIQLGEHVVRVLLTAHTTNPESLKVTVVAEEIVEASFTLMEHPGSIFVTSSPLGAAILLDGSDTGHVTPDTLAGLASGDYEVRVELTGHVADPDLLVVTVAPDEVVTADFNLLAPQTGNLAVTSSPPGAAIILDDQDTGRVTPDTLFSLEPGNHVVKVVLTGYAASPESLIVAIVADQTTQAHFDLTPLVGELSVTSTPAGAAVILDGADSGQTTPALLTGLSVGDHVVTVHQPPLLVTPDSRVVTIQAGQTANADFVLDVQKVVLIESFSNVSCIGCPEMATAINDLMTTPGYETDKLLAVKFSMNWPQLTDPHFQANPEDNLARATYYQDYLMVGIPTLAGDGMLWGASGQPPELAELTTLVDGRLSNAPGFGIAVEATVLGNAVNATVTLIATSAVDLPDHSLHVVLVENPIIYDTPPGNQGETEFHWVMRDFETSTAALPSLTPGSPFVVQQILNREPYWLAENLFVIAIVQDNQTREILQAGSDADRSHAVPYFSVHSHETLLPSTLPSGGIHP